MTGEWLCQVLASGHLCTFILGTAARQTPLEQVNVVLTYKTMHVARRPEVWHAQALGGLSLST